MIYTLTINPAIDMNIATKEIRLGTVNRTHDAVYSPNGKGLNVSFTLKHFGTPSGIIGFFGGFSGEYILHQCKAWGYEVRPVMIDGITRINVFVETDCGECKLVNAGPVVDESSQKQMLDLLANIPDLDCLVISGSLAAGICDDYLEQILDVCAAKNAEVIVDISSHKLKDLLRYKPLLIKPNDEELAEIFGLEMANAKDALLRLHHLGAQNVLITMGKNGSYFYNGTDMYFCDPYPVKQVSSACAGDAFLGAFLSQWLSDRAHPARALQIASAAGANTAESNGLGDFSKVPDYAEKIKVTKI